MAGTDRCHGGLRGCRMGSSARGRRRSAAAPRTLGQPPRQRKRSGVKGWWCACGRSARPPEAPPQFGPSAIGAAPPHGRDSRRPCGTYGAPSLVRRPARGMGGGTLQPFSLKSHTPTLPKEFQIGLYDQFFGTVGAWDFWENGCTSKKTTLSTVCSRSLKNPSLQALRKYSKSASAGSQRPIWNSLQQLSAGFLREWLYCNPLNPVETSQFSLAFRTGCSQSVVMHTYT